MCNNSRGLRISLFSLIALALLGSAAAAELEWKQYTNARFGFALSYPAELVAGREPDNGAGREFHTKDKAFSLSAQAHFFAPDIGDTFEARWQDELKTPDVTIAYKRKTPTWYVVSGVAKNGTEYYHKLYTRGDNWVALEVTYPHAQNARYDKWVEEIVDRFVPFLEGDYDRVD